MKCISHIDSEYISQMRYTHSNKGSFSFGPSYANTTILKQTSIESARAAALATSLATPVADKQTKAPVKRISISSIAKTKKCCFCCLFDNHKNDFFKATGRKSISSINRSLNDINTKNFADNKKRFELQQLLAAKNKESLANSHSSERDLNFVPKNLNHTNKKVKMSFETITNDDMYSAKFKDPDDLNSLQSSGIFDKIIFSNNQTLPAGDINNNNNNNKVKANSSDHSMDTSHNSNSFVYFDLPSPNKLIENYDCELKNLMLTSHKKLSVLSDESENLLAQSTIEAW